MMLPMLIVVHGNPLFNNDDSFARWEDTVTAMSPKEAPDAIRSAKAQLQLMESWLVSRPEERQIFVSLKMPQYQLEICLQRHSTISAGVEAKEDCCSV
jgi:hypothetical protein